MKVNRFNNLGGNISSYKNVQRVHQSKTALKGGLFISDAKTREPLCEWLITIKK